jgi:glycerol kinase
MVSMILWQVTLRLVWVLQNVEALQRAARCHQAMFGTIDTWLLYRLTGCKLHVTDVSSASATGFYDPFVMEWCNWVLRLFRIPPDMLPDVWDTASDFGCITSDILGAAVPIRSLVCSPGQK